ncbi:MAG TPA: hypothetical protein VF950_29230, partial [Planctomycetota bacterium]
MSDDLERRLDDLYRQAREDAEPIRERWKLEPRLDDLYRQAREEAAPIRARWKARRVRPLLWASVAAAAALALFLPLLLRKSPPVRPHPAQDPVVTAPPAPAPAPTP